MFAPVRLQPLKSACPNMPSSRLALLRFLLRKSTSKRGGPLLTASSRHVLKSLKKPAKRVSSVSFLVSL